MRFLQGITERKNKEDEILYLSYHDSLIRLYNCIFFEEELTRLDTKTQLPLSLIMSDLNGFKMINDVFCQTQGDNLFDLLLL